MFAFNLPEEDEQHFQEVVQIRYHGNVQDAMASLLRLHDRYGWKEQLREDVESVRTEVRRQAGISDKAIDEAISTYRRRRSI